MSELKPCPFCGGEAIGYEWSDDDEIEEGEPHRYDAYCSVKVDHKDDCVLEVGEFYCWIASTEEEAAELWNRRAERTCRMVDCGSHDTCVVNRELSNGNIMSMEFGYRQCSECGANVFDCPAVRYCPNCGAKVVVE